MTPGLEDVCQKGTPGLLRIEYVYLADVDPASLVGIIGQGYNRPFDVLLLDGAWQVLPCFRPPRWVENHQADSQGGTYEQLLSASVRQLKPAASGIFDELSRNRLLLRIRDRDGRNWICGNTDEGFDLTYRRSPGGGENSPAMSYS